MVMVWSRCRKCWPQVDRQSTVRKLTKHLKNNFAQKLCREIEKMLLMPDLLGTHTQIYFSLFALAPDAKFLNITQSAHYLAINRI